MSSELVRQILDGDVSFFEGSTALTATGWLRHPERYFNDWLDDIDARRPRRYARTLLLGMWVVLPRRRASTPIGVARAC